MDRTTLYLHAVSTIAHLVAGLLVTRGAAVQLRGQVSIGVPVSSGVPRALGVQPAQAAAARWHQAQRAHHQVLFCEGALVLCTVRRRETLRHGQQVLVLCSPQEWSGPTLEEAGR